MYFDQHCRGRGSFRTESNSRLIELCPSPAFCHSKPVSTKSLHAVKSEWSAVYVLASIIFQPRTPAIRVKDPGGWGYSFTCNLRSGCQRPSRTITSVLLSGYFYTRLT